MPLKTYQEQPPELNLTPMIDIVFLLIIFFMVGTKFAEMERTVDLDVPQVRNIGSLSSPDSKHVINVYQDGVILLGQQTVTLDELGPALEQARTNAPAMSVIVRGDGQGSFQNIANVLTACREAGIRNLGVSVQSQREATKRR